MPQERPHRSWIAVALMLLPLIIAGLISYWPKERSEIGRVVILPAKLYGQADTSNLAASVPPTLLGELGDVKGITVTTADTAAEADVAVIPSLTLDSGLLQLNLEVMDSRTQKEIWNEAFQAPQAQYSEMMRAAAARLRTVLLR